MYCFWSGVTESATQKFCFRFDCAQGFEFYNGFWACVGDDIDRDDDDDDDDDDDGDGDGDDDADDDDGSPSRFM